MTGLGNRVGATILQIHILSKPPLQPVPCEQVHWCEATGVWLIHTTHAVNHKSKKPIMYRSFMHLNYTKIY